MTDSLYNKEPRVIAFPQDRARGGLPPGSGGGTYDEMDARVKVLEHRADQVEKRLDGIDVKLDRILSELGSFRVDVSGKFGQIDGLLKALPTAWQMVIALAGLFLGVVGVAFAAVKIGMHP